ncbi:MAG: bifunctional sugar-1-phosphate nucleotidylyltransferase/acetyltransferase [Candidatus Bathyarchaeia archaeon]
MKAVILAAGRGTRLKPLTDRKPKHLLPIGGKPLLEWLLINVKDAGIREIIVVTHYMGNRIRGFFGDGSRLGIKIRYLKQEEMGGTADAFMTVRDYVDEDFLGLYGDLYLSKGVLRGVLQRYRGDPMITAVHIDDPSKYGVIEVEGGKLKGIVEKPEPGTEPSKLANAGIYVLPPDMFNYITVTGLSPRGELEVTDTLQAMVDDGVSFDVCEISLEDWIDIGLPWNMLDANERAMRLLDSRIEGDVEEGARIIDPVVIEEGARVRSGTYIEGPAIIDSGSHVGPNCYLRPFTYLGKRTRVGNACEVKNSIIMDDTHIAHLSYVGDSIIGEECNLGAGTITANLRFDKGDIKVEVKGERTTSNRHKLGTFMGDGAQTGINVGIMPGVKIGTGSWVAPGLTVAGDLPSDSFLDSEGVKHNTRVDMP